jgi:hypothetical protein
MAPLSAPFAGYMPDVPAKLTRIPIAHIAITATASEAIAVTLLASVAFERGPTTMASAPSGSSRTSLTSCATCAGRARATAIDPKTGGGGVMKWLLEEPPSLGTNLKQYDGADYCG